MEGCLGLVRDLGSFRADPRIERLKVLALFGCLYWLVYRGSETRIYSFGV